MGEQERGRLARCSFLSFIHLHSCFSFSFYLHLLGQLEDLELGAACLKECLALVGAENLGASGHGRLLGGRGGQGGWPRNSEKE